MGKKANEPFSYEKRWFFWRKIFFPTEREFFFVTRHVQVKNDWIFSFLKRIFGEKTKIFFLLTKILLSLRRFFSFKKKIPHKWRIFGFSKKFLEFQRNFWNSIKIFRIPKNYWNFIQMNCNFPSKILEFLHSKPINLISSSPYLQNHTFSMKNVSNK